MLIASIGCLLSATNLRLLPFYQLPHCSCSIRQKQDPDAILYEHNSRMCKTLSVIFGSKPREIKALLDDQPIVTICRNFLSDRLVKAHPLLRMIANVLSHWRKGCSMKIAMWIRREQLTNQRYERTRWLVMTATALAAFAGFQLFDSYFFGS
jgi:hypothetical protein